MSAHSSISRVAGALLAVGALGLTACSDSGSGSEEDLSLNIGYFPLAHTSSVVHAHESGILEEHGIEAELLETEGGAHAIPALTSGQFDITYANYTSAILAAEQGLPVRIIAPNDVGGDDHGLYVRPDSDIDGVENLTGHTLTVNNLENIGSVAFYAHLEDAGESPGSADLVEMPNPDMRAALDNGNVDVIWQVEPFQTMAEQDGFTRIGNLFSGQTEGVPVAGWVTTEEFAEDNPEVIDAFQEAMAESTQELNDDGDQVRELVPTFTQLEADLVDEMVLPEFQSELDVEWLQRMTDLMERYDMIEESFDINEIVID